MAHLIDKDTLVAKIEKFEKALKNACKPNPFGNVEECMTAAELQALDLVKETINTLEVKEVDLEKELDSMITPELKFHKAFPSLFDVAKHFFELGLKAQKP